MKNFSFINSQTDTNAKAWYGCLWGTLRKKGRIFVSFYKEFSCCNKKIKSGELCFLKDIKGFTARKILITKCDNCKEIITILTEKRISDNKIFINFSKGINAVKTIYRERKRIVQMFPDIKLNSLYGWVYGHNVQIKNKKGEVTQIRQYGSDFRGNRELVKKIICEQGK